MKTIWKELLIMSPVLIEGVVALLCGIYELISLKESFLMSRYRKKYNYKKSREKFIRLCGIFHIIGGIFLVGIYPVFSIFASLKELIFISIPVLGIMAIGQYIMVRLYTYNLEKRKY